MSSFGIAFKLSNHNMFWFNMCMCALLLRIVTWKLQKGHRSQLSDINKLTLSPCGFFFLSNVIKLYGLDFLYV